MPHSSTMQSPTRRLGNQLSATPVRTVRLALRLPQPTDAELIFDGYARDPDVVRFLPFLPHSDVSATQEMVGYWIEAWRRGSGELNLIMEHAGNGALLGVVSFHPGPHGVELGAVLRRSAWGCGYVQEAQVPVIAAAFDELGAWRVWATCWVENPAARQALERAGLRHEGVLRRWTRSPLVSPDPLDVHCLSVTRDDRGRSLQPGDRGRVVR